MRSFDSAQDRLSHDYEASELTLALLGDLLEAVVVILSEAKNLWAADLRNLSFDGQMVRFAHHDKSEYGLEMA